MTPPRSRLLSLVHFCEHRGDRSYDEQDSSHLYHPNGSLIASYDRDFLAAATREVMDMHVHQAMEAVSA